MTTETERTLRKVTITLYYDEVGRVRREIGQMTTHELEKDYRRARADHPYMPAQSALALARYRASDPVLDLDWTGDGNAEGATFDSDGFTIHARWVLDEDAEPRVCESEDPASGIRNPRARYYGTDDYGRPRYGSRFDDNAPAWVSFESGETLDGLARWYHEHEGASRSVARDYARESLAREAADYLWDYGKNQYGCIVEVYRAGVELGTASLWGIEESDDYRESMLYRAETVRELLSEALNDARATLASLCASEGLVT